MCQKDRAFLLLVTASEDEVKYKAVPQEITGLSLRIAG